MIGGHYSAECVFDMPKGLSQGFVTREQSYVLGFILWLNHLFLSILNEILKPIISISLFSSLKLLLAVYFFFLCLDAVNILDRGAINHFMLK